MYAGSCLGFNLPAICTQCSKESVIRLRKMPRKVIQFDKLGPQVPGSSTVEHSAVNHTAEHHKPLFWRRLATMLSPLVVPHQCPSTIHLEGVSPTDQNFLE
jgi:hypothetical protein